MTPNPNLRSGNFSSEKGASRPGGASASAGASGGSKAPRLSGTLNPFARAAEMGASAGLDRLLGPLQVRPATSQRQRVFEEWFRVGLSRRSTLKAGSPVLDRYGRHLRGASWDSSLKKMGFGAVPLTARFGESRGEQTRRTKVSFRVRYCRLLVCPASR